MKRNEPSLLQVLFRSRNFELKGKWNEPAVNELCNKLNWTKYDLGAYVGLDRGLIDLCIKKNKFSIAVCMHFQSLDEYATAIRGGEVPVSPLDKFIK